MTPQFPQFPHSAWRRSQAAPRTPDRLDKIALLEGWRELPGSISRGVTAEEALREVSDNPTRYETLRAFFLRRSRDGKLPTARQIGNFIRGMQGSKYNGLVITSAGTHKRSALWKVTGEPENDPDSQKTDARGESGESGDFQTHPRKSNRDNDLNTTGESGESSFNPSREAPESVNISYIRPGEYRAESPPDSPDSPVDVSDYRTRGSGGESGNRQTHQTHQGGYFVTDPDDFNAGERFETEMILGD